jgi:hypothetical protein
MSPEYDHLLGDEELVGLESRPIDEVRSLRASCVDVETGLSYLRRLVQGSLDIIERELMRRGAGGDPQSVGELVDQLPDILGEVPRPPGVGRLTQTLEPTEFDDELVDAYNALVGDGRLAHVADLGGGQLVSLMDQLREVERQVSAKRSAFHVRIDALQAELTRRYRTGEASVDTLLAES